MFAWAAGRPERPVLIAGHTHRPVFGESAPKPKVVRSAADVQRELDAQLADPAAEPDRIAALRSEVEYVVAEERRVDPPKPIVPPCLFNTGCCSFGDGNITGLELADGQIRLVRWSADERLPDRRVLAHDELTSILTSVRRTTPA
jgi:hypothetical protein